MVRAEYVRCRDPCPRGGRRLSTAEGLCRTTRARVRRAAREGEPWGKSGLQIDVLVNPEDITRLVVFDTWTLNCDRHHHDLTVRKPNYDNVYLSREGVESGKLPVDRDGSRTVLYSVRGRPFR